MMPKGFNYFDFIIIGAGTAGLTAAIYASKHDYTVIILEKGSCSGPKPRGETIHHYPLLDEVLGKDFIKSISKHETANRLFHSPKNKFQTLIKASSTSYVFEWRDLFNRFDEIIEELDIDIRFNCEVIQTIEEDGICSGVEYKDTDGNLRKVFGKAVLACDGSNSVLGKQYRINYKKINNPIIKCIVKNAKININKQSALELFLLAKGELEFAPTFPPCVLFVFPRGGTDIEIGLMLFISVALEMGVEIPSDDELWKVWTQIKSSYSGFKEFLEGSEIIYEEITGITSSGFVKNYIPKPGLVLIGDSAGFIEASGSSGLYSSMEMAKFWAELIANQLQENERLIWTDENIKKYKKLFHKTSIYKHIIGVYKIFLGFLRKLFRDMQTAEEINNNWDNIASILQRAKSST
ncbi:MAG: NAD(P)/FAD-dependent oxidoreductase [Promethearchaeota archaeon]